MGSSHVFSDIFNFAHLKLSQPNAGEKDRCDTQKSSIRNLASMSCL